MTALRAIDALDAPAPDHIERAMHGHHPGAQEVVRVAHQLGWDVKAIPTAKRDAHAIVLTRQVDGHPFSVHIPPTGQYNDGKLNSLRRKVYTYGDPVKKKMFDLLLDKAFGDKARDMVDDIATDLARTVLTARDEKEPPMPPAPAHTYDYFWTRAQKYRPSYIARAVLVRDKGTPAETYVCPYVACDVADTRQTSVSTHVQKAHEYNKPGHAASDPTHLPMPPADAPFTWRPPEPVAAPPRVLEPVTVSLPEPGSALDVAAKEMATQPAAPADDTFAQLRALLGKVDGQLQDIDALRRDNDELRALLSSQDDEIRELRGKLDQIRGIACP